MEVEVRNKGSMVVMIADDRTYHTDLDEEALEGVRQSALRLWRFVKLVQKQRRMAHEQD